ncbi:hypothetical protein CLOM_g13440 [Closterium sp. NIES-68]|nr:hypothetical protein CLOM_g13440 [Closterium sp. NIES-68]GJP72455.1 hypothetical protein CLOP_g3187 [Closterium sp. NIES-67]
MASRPADSSASDPTEPSSTSTPTKTMAAQRQGYWAHVFDRSTFGTRGEVWVPLQLLAMALVFFPLPDWLVADKLGLPLSFCPSYSVREGAFVAGVPLLVLSVYLGLAAFNDLAGSFSPFPKPRADGGLKTGGVYRFVRHPMYAAAVLLSTAVACVTCSTARLVAAGAMVVIHDAKARVEERHLREMFGARYLSYMKKVKRFVPLLY